MLVQPNVEPYSKRRKLSHGNSDSESKPMEDAQERSSHSSTNGRMSASTLTRSTTIALQAKDLVRQLTPNYETRLKKVQPILDELITAIRAIAPTTSISLAEAEKALINQGISIPFASHRPTGDIKYTFSFPALPDIRIGGGYSLQISDTYNGDIKLSVQLSEKQFHEKDFLDYRAFHKRAYVMACLAAGITKSLTEDFKAEFDLQDGNELLPILCITRPGAPIEVMNNRVVIDAVFPNSLGPILKTLPVKNCVRYTMFVESSSAEERRPTPFYNSTLRATATTHAYGKLIVNAAHQCESFKDACILGQIWLRQRGFGGFIGEGGFGMYEWAVLTALLLNDGGPRGRPLFSDRYTFMQLFKAVLQVLSTRDFIQEPLYVRGLQGELAATSGSSPTVLDMSTGVNILYKMSKSSYSRLRNMAHISSEAINARLFNSFEQVFIYKVSDPLMEFDEVYTINWRHLPSNYENEQPDDLRRLYHVLERGLGDRVTRIHIGHPDRQPWNLNKAGPTHTQTSTVRIGLSINSDAANRMLDHGPSVEEQEECKDFRRFWGEKSELRRFQDGRITETLVWSSASPVTYQIIQYLLLFHFNIASSDAVKVTPDIAANRMLSAQPVVAMEAFQTIRTRYQELSSKLHQLEGFPLPIRSVSACHPNLSSADMESPLSPRTARPTDVLIQFDSSTRWPDHLPAIQYTKIAFLAKLSDLLIQANPSWDGRIGIENQEHSTRGYLNTSFLDIIQQSPGPGLCSVIFRLRIYHDRELHLIQSRLSSKDLSSSNREQLSGALLKHKQDFIASPPHTTAIHNLVTHYAPLSGTIRLLKAWVASHNLSNHIPEPALEIIAAHVFLRPFPWTVPGTITTGFIRCLHFLSHWDWASSPLIIDLSLTQDMPSTMYSELATRFDAWRKLDPAMNNVAWFVGTSIDNTGTIWTQGARPARVVASRVTALAKAAIELIRTKDVSMHKDDWSNLFVSGTGDFDFVIHLRSSFVKGYRGGSSNGKSSKSKNSSEFKNLVLQEELDVDSIGHDPINLFLQDLERIFSHGAVFFYGVGRDVIGGLWRPNATAVKEWRVRLGYSSIPVVAQQSNGSNQGQALCRINQDGIINEIAKLGEGMIERIVTKR